MNEDSIKKLMIKVETVLCLMVIYLCCSKFLNWIKTLYSTDLSVFRTIISVIIAIAVFMFFALTIVKTHWIAKHFMLIFCASCLYLHFDVLFTYWFVGLVTVFVFGVAYYFAIKNTLTEKSYYEETIAENNVITFCVLVFLSSIAQLAYWVGMYIG